MPRLANKVAIITGAARGLGRAMALRFAEEGCSLSLSDLNLAGVEQTARECEGRGRAHGVRTLTSPTNVTDRSAVEKMVAETAAQLGRLDILVNNAGIFGNAAFESMTDAEWGSMIGINLTGVFLVSQVAVRHWLKAGQPGNIINLASISAVVAFTESAHYCAAKAGVAELTRCVAMEMGPQGIRCNSMAPGIIATDMTANSLNDPSHSGDWLQRIPQRRYGSPEDVANLALFLASDESSYINGAMIYADGGGVYSWPKPSDAQRYPRPVTW